MTNAKLLSRSDVAPLSAASVKTDTWGAGREVTLPVTDAVTVRPEEPIGRAIRLLNRSRLSALPVVDASGRMGGFITERDLLTRLASRRRSWWSSLWANNKELIEKYRKAVGTTVGEVMGPPPIPVPVGASIQAAVDLFAKQGLRELPFVADGRVVGMVTRPSLLALLELSQPPISRTTDAELVAEMKNRLRQEPWVTNRRLYVQATEGIVFLAGPVETEEEKAALETMARAIPGCIGVDNHTFARTALRGRGI